MQKNDIYKCPICGNIIEVVHVGGGTLVCCGQSMEKQEANTVDASLEKHVPIIQKTAAGVKINVGSVPHPMEEAHYIEWIEVMVGDYVERKYLKPGDAPEAEFELSGDGLTACAYCNLHGLWQNK
jgi:superoxide reductase